MSLSQTSKIIVAFSMPGLERVARPLYEFEERAKAVALVAYIAARWATGSAEALDAELRNPTMWKLVRDAAAAQGRLYPDKPPTFNKVHHLCRRIGDRLDEVLLEMWAEFTAVAFELARSVGLCHPESIGSLLDPLRSNTLYADGTWFHPLSNVKLDPATGEFTGSRAKALAGVDAMSAVELSRLQGPRVAEVQQTTKHGKLLIGKPYVFAGVRGDEPLQRVMLGARRFSNPLLPGDGGETGAAIELLQRIIGAADGGIGWCVYDMAFTGYHLDKLARIGVVGVAAMRSADSDKAHLAVVEGGPTRYNGDSRKSRLRTAGIRTVTHRVGDSWCEHALSSVDGSLRVHPTHRQVEATDPVCAPVDLWFEPDKRFGRRMKAKFEVLCPNGPSIVPTIELTGDVPRGSGLMLNRLRPINEYHPAFQQMHGWRQDVESTNSTIKRWNYLDGRASSLDAAKFELDILGAALMVNAQCWDVHVAGFTGCAREVARLAQNRVLRSV